MCMNGIYSLSDTCTVQVMQQKSHEILSSKCAEAEADRGDADADDDGHERHARRLLEEALSADWPRQDHHHHHHHHHHHVDVTVRLILYHGIFK